MISSRIPILMYHNIGSVSSSSSWRNLVVSPKAFRQQMMLLRSLGFRGRSIRDATRALKGESRARTAVITFDDGFADVHENALPILKDFGFTATCYFVSRCIGAFNSWDRDAAVERRPTMTQRQAEEWAQAGMEIGSHTCSHPRLTSCTQKQCDDELTSSREELEQKFGVGVDSFSYPFGDYNDQVVSSVQAAGYTSAVTTRMGRVMPGSDPFRMCRVDVNGRRGLLHFTLGVSTNFQNWRKRRPS